jgi:phosphate transport system substrate-binding protein
MLKNNLMFILVILLFSTCLHQPPPKIKYIRLHGSDTMKILALRWAEEYMREHPDISIYIEGGGSAMGFQALIKNETDICASSRPMMPHEVRQLAEKRQRLGIAHLVAKDALSIYLNKANPVSNMSLDQLKSIYSGKITNWKEIGGEDHRIIPIARSPNSGTFYYFKEHVLNDEPYADNVLVRYTTQTVVDGVLENNNAIGYGGTAFGEKVVHCKIDGVAPTVENVIHDKYPLARYLYLYTLDKPKGHLKEFIDWILDTPGQVIIAKVGYIPLFQPESLQPTL